jgi:anti-sigma B factor antagonist
VIDQSGEGINLMLSKGEGPVTQPKARRHLDVENVEGVLLICFTTPRVVQEEDIQAIFEQLQGLLDNKTGQELVLDFRKVQFLSSAVLGQLILLQKRAVSTGGRMVLCGIAKEIFEVFKITKLDKLFNIKEDAKAALKVFGVSAENRRQRLEDD